NIETDFHNIGGVDENILSGSFVAIVPISPDSNLEFIKRYDKNTFTEEQVNQLILAIRSHPFTYGSVGNVYYKLIPKDSNYLLVASDMSDFTALYAKNVLNTFLSIGVVYVLLFLVVWRLSFTVFQPLRESLYKQKQFISNASHELKTPLSIISANVDVISSDGENKWAQNIKHQTKRMDGLVADMLTLAKMDEEKIKINPIEFNLSEEIINDVLPFDAVAFEKGKTLDLDVENDIIYKGDLQSVKKIVNILLDNAVKHADVGGQIVVTLKKENGKIIFAVYNSGSKVPNFDSNKVFERFYRADASRSRDSGGGSGLGLAIAKGIADANKWKISANSVFNQSMTITVLF
ncbi:MAG: HAMP domain-containing histidine kinase, partial [Clostridia bacterium]|nr:HAMP domain-containing histidine kinase [Clostridia bacterium]